MELTDLVKKGLLSLLRAGSGSNNQLEYGESITHQTILSYNGPQLQSSGRHHPTLLWCLIHIVRGSLHTDGVSEIEHIRARLSSIPIVIQLDRDSGARGRTAYTRYTRLCVCWDLLHEVFHN